MAMKSKSKHDMASGGSHIEAVDKKIATTPGVKVGRVKKKVESTTIEMLIKDIYSKVGDLPDDDYREKINLLKTVLNYASQDSEHLKEYIAVALLKLSSCYGEMKDYEQSIHYAYRLFNQYGDDQNTNIKYTVAKGLVNIAISQSNSNKLIEAIDTYTQAIDFLGDPSNEDGLEVFARATFNKAIALADIGKIELALSSYDKLIDLITNDNLSFVTYAAESLVNKSNLLLRIKRYDETIKLADKGIDALVGHADTNIASQRIGLIAIKAIALAASGKTKEAIKAYGAVDKLVIDKSDSLMLEHYGKILFNKAVLFASIKDNESAISVVKQFEKFFGELNNNNVIAQIFSNIYKLKQVLELATGEKDEESTKLAVEATKNDLSANLSVYLTNVFKYIDKKKQAEYFERINNSKRFTDKFIKESSCFDEDASIFLVLRLWNSYTPIVPAEEESDRGGGYYLRHSGEGVVVDPGYDFIDNFFRAGGRYCDIDHIVITHAHDDHTAEFESLLMLLHQYNQANNVNKRISLYLSQGAHKKFSGLLDLRDKRYKNIITLCAAAKGFEQRIKIHDTLHMTVLPAYHDDVISGNSAIGIGFEVITDKKVRKIIITGDSGLFPRKYDSTGSPQYYDVAKKEPELDATSDSALYCQYPQSFLKPDLLIAHIGSIKESEFGVPELNPDKKVGQWFYANHLGLLGTLTMMHQLYPEVAIISEFGSELKGFHIELVAKLEMALNERQEYDNPVQKKTFVMPGDLTIIYNIKEKKFLCHDTNRFSSVSELVCRAARSYTPHWDSGAKEFDAVPNEADERVYLFKKTREVDASIDNKVTKEYFKRYYNHKLPIHKSN